MQSIVRAIEGTSHMLPGFWWVACLLCDLLNLIFLICACTSCRMYQIVKLLYSFGIYITYALQFYVAAEILISPAVARVRQRWALLVDLSIRVGLVLLTCESKSKKKKKCLIHAHLIKPHSVYCVCLHVWHPVKTCCGSVLKTLL